MHVEASIYHNRLNTVFGDAQLRGESPVVFHVRVGEFGHLLNL